MRWGSDPWVREISWRQKWQATPVFLPGESRGQRRRLGDYSPQGRRVRHDWSNLVYTGVHAMTNQSIFSCACWPYFYVLWKNIQIFCSLFGYLSFYCWVIIVHYIFWIQIPYQMHDYANIFSILWIVFIFLIRVIVVAQKFLILV